MCTLLTRCQDLVVNNSPAQSKKCCVHQFAILKASNLLTTIINGERLDPMPSPVEDVFGFLVLDPAETSPCSECPLRRRERVPLTTLDPSESGRFLRICNDSDISIHRSKDSSFEQKYRALAAFLLQAFLGALTTAVLVFVYPESVFSDRLQAFLGARKAVLRWGR